jgi:ribonucleoside-diphosphate reductase alpha chain
LGTIRSSNLCTEILEYTAPDEIAVCNLCSIALPEFVIAALQWGTKTRSTPVSELKLETLYNFDLLYKVARLVARSLNRVIDRNAYPTPETKKSNFRHRPIGIGVQGLADVFIKLKWPFMCDQAAELDWQLFECIYFAALTQSWEQAVKDGKPYETFAGSPLSQGKFQFDLWPGKTKLSGRWDWEDLRGKIKRDGVANSLLLAPMPTASTSQILGWTEAFEMINSNMGNRNTLSGPHPMVTDAMVDALVDLKMWNPVMQQRIMASGGKISKIADIPQEVREVFTTVWETPQKSVMKRALARARFIDQGQSLNIHMERGTPAEEKKLSINQRLTNLHLYAWAEGAKNGMYYFRTKPAVNAAQFTVDINRAIETMGKRNREKRQKELEEQEIAARRGHPDKIKEIVLAPLKPPGGVLQEKQQEGDKDFCTRDDPDCKNCGS